MSSSSHPNKRIRIAREGGSNRDFVPLPDDYYSDVVAREGHLRSRVGVATRVTTQKSSKWMTATSWAPSDDPEYALDPDGAWYDEAVDGHVMEDVRPITLEVAKKKKKRSRISKRPHVVWKEVSRSLYLDELLRFAGRGEFRTATECPDCVARGQTQFGIPEYRCRECFMPDLTCSACCIRRHRTHPLHVIEKWSGSHFTKVSLKSMGLKVQLNHPSMFCQNPIPCHRSMVVIHTNGLHEVAFNYCGCSRAIPQHLQLMRRRFYPASQMVIRTCASFEVLDILHKFSLTTKASTFDFYRAIEKLTSDSGLAVPSYRCRVLSRILLQWRHLKLLKWSGRAHDPAGVDATLPGQLALRCPSCPYQGINLSDEWEDSPPEKSYLYMPFICMDANFRLKNQLVSNYSQDPGLGIGWAYMLPRQPYEDYVLSQAKDEDISTCVGFQALAQANNRFSKGLRYTGVGGAFCGRSEMVLPIGIGNLQKGERYANMDYVFASAIQQFPLPRIGCSYDVICQWIKNLRKRSEQWPVELRLPSTTKIIPAIPKLHEPSHSAANHQVYSLNYIPGVGLSDFECPERVWAGHNAVGNSTKSQGPGSRHDVLDDHFNFWNWQKYIGLGKTLKRKYRIAVADRNIQVEGHRGLTATLENEVVKRWEAICIQWEQEDFPKKSKNPYESDTVALTEAQAKRELIAEEERRLAGGGVALHAKSAPAFIVMGLELEETQRRLRRLAKDITSQSTARQAGGLIEQRNQLTARMRVWEQLLPLYLPGLLQHQANLRTQANYDPKLSEHPEDIELWLPSRLPADIRASVCIANLPKIEEKLRTAQCYDALDIMRHTLRIKSRLVLFKNKNVRGQREGLRSRSIIGRVHERARVAAEKYRAARAAKLELSGPGGWEHELQILTDADIRGYQDANQLKQRRGRRGTLEDNQVFSIPMDPPIESNDFTLFTEERSRRDGTGETRRTLSWIWLVKTQTDGAENGDDDDILRIEWSKSRARAKRAQEEVLLLQEEMRRSLQYLAWKAHWWESQAAARSVDKGLAEGLQAYSAKQARLQCDLADLFRTLWKDPLQEATNSDPPIPQNETNLATPRIDNVNANSAGTQEADEEEADEEEDEDDDEEGGDDDYEDYVVDDFDDQDRNIYF